MDPLPAAGEQQGCLSVLLAPGFEPKPRETNSMRCESCSPAAHRWPVTIQQAEHSERGAMAGESGVQGRSGAWIWAPETSRRQLGAPGQGGMGTGPPDKWYPREKMCM